MIVRSMKLSMNRNSWSGHVGDDPGVNNVEIRGFIRIISFYGRGVNDSNYRDNAYYLSYMCNENSRTMIKVPLIFRIDDEIIEDSWKFIGTAVTDEGRRVIHCFQPTICSTGIMST